MHAQHSGESRSGAQPSEEFLRTIPHEYARRHLVLSEGATAEAEHVVVAPGTRDWVVFNIGVALGRQVCARVGDAEAIAAAVDHAYAATVEDPGDGAVLTVEGAADMERELGQAVAAAEHDGDLLATRGKGPAVRLVDLALFEAILRGASDVHVQPVRGRTLVRYRLDGALRTVRELPGSVAAAVVSRVKVIARLDVAERRAPQDGRASVTIGTSIGSSRAGRRVDLRVSTLPTASGERVVLRLLDPERSARLLEFTALGMPGDLEVRYKEAVSRASGIVLSTGPTGSGKTTTLYTTLAWICATDGGASRESRTETSIGADYPTGACGSGNPHDPGPASPPRACELNILTVEDPVEYDLSGPGLSISQMQVDAKKGVTFASGLRHILRQDPDVIMVGEIRDQETARIAVQASLTGHLVLSTLHTNDAPSAVARLLDLGVEPFLVAGSLSAVLAQRLVRMVHAPCAGSGCPACLHTGFRGRTGIFELCIVDAPLRDLIVRRAVSQEIRRAAEKAGMISLERAGAALAASGVTTRQEVARIIDPVPEESET